ncbi:hypothetical protein SAMN06295905_1559 [Devosia lucknowensis]|uniref:Uncharacterized protein n=1 Tax=Devosia lucknowensis TaxID=1096929 RepID=A0A1Y6EXY8_9HYPH|nr:hypothetical protein [Devosia lucknowensis]SMQ67407.1 hypothetical protein SAMN06295905_1559 [Devosia lucknowensis]
MPRPTFKPNLNLGDLLVLADLADATQDGKKTGVSKAVMEKTGASSTRVRNALLRIESELGPVEYEGKMRRTHRPNPRGRNVGGAGVVADLLIKIASDPDTDQTRLSREIENIIHHIRRQRRAGNYSKLPE